MAQTITVSDVIPATPADIYMAWLDSVAHAAMTGGGKAEASPDVGGEHSAWDGYISGMNLALFPGQRIEQSWRSTDFKPEDADSTLTVVLDPVDGGTKVTLVHANLPDHQTGYEQGWRDWYLEPMKAYFAALGVQFAEAEPPAMKPEQKATVRKAAAPKVGAPKATAKPPAAKKPAARKVAASKTAAKTAAKKPAARKIAAKKPATRKTAAKKPAARKAAAKKPAARRAAVKKPAARKAAAKKPAAKRPAAKKPAKRPVARKAAAGRSAARKAVGRKKMGAGKKAGRGRRG